MRVASIGLGLAIAACTPKTTSDVPGYRQARGVGGRHHSGVTVLVHPYGVGEVDLTVGVKRQSWRPFSLPPTKTHQCVRVNADTQVFVDGVQLKLKYSGGLADGAYFSGVRTSGHCAEASFHAPSGYVFDERAQSEITIVDRRWHVTMQVEGLIGSNDMAQVRILRCRGARKCAVRIEPKG